MNQYSFTYRPDLQGLRAIAVMLVILAHSGLEIVPGGFIGVDIFFVISGYLISALLLREQATTGRIDFTAFYARRLKRLLPALVCMLCVTSAAAVFLLSGYEAGKQLASGPYAAGWISNLHFAFGSVDYFDELSGLDLFLHTWSLGVEEQFYLLWPVVLLALTGLSGREQGIRISLSTGIMLACLVSLLLSLYWTVEAPQSAFYLMPSRIWQFGLGALVFLAENTDGVKKFLRRSGSELMMRTVGLLLIIGSASGLHDNLAWPGLWAILPSAGAALVIAAYVESESKPGLLSSSALVWLGDRSYSLYLWHWPVLILGFSLGLRGQMLFTLYLLLLTLLLSIFSYRYIELPYWKGRFSSWPPGHTLYAGILAIVVVVALFKYGLNLLPQNPPPKSPRSDLPDIYTLNCDAWFFHARVEPCMSGPDDADRTVVFVGDSHGGQWYSFIPEIYTQPDWRIIALTKSACPMVDEEYYYATIKQIYTTCTEWRNSVLDELDKLQPEVIITGSASTYEFSRDEWVNGSTRILARMSQAAGQVIVIAGTPVLGFDGPGCAERNMTRQAGTCSSSEGIQKANEVSGFLEQAATSFPNVRVLNLNDLVCPDDRCAALSAEGTYVYRDSQHLTDTFVRTLIPEIRRRIVTKQ